MPLSMGKSPASFSRNVSTEMHEGKPLKQSLAIAYAMKRKAAQMAKGGMMHKREMPCAAHGMMACHMCSGGDMMAEGGEIEHEEKSSGYHHMPEEHEHHPHHEPMEEDEEMPMEEDDMVARIMAKIKKDHEEGMHVRKEYSEGGRVSNDDEPLADFEKNQFDDLVKNVVNFSKNILVCSGCGKKLDYEHLSKKKLYKK